MHKNIKFLVYKKREVWKRLEVLDTKRSEGRKRKKEDSRGTRACPGGVLVWRLPEAGLARGRSLAQWEEPLATMGSHGDVRVCAFVCVRMCV